MLISYKCAKRSKIKYNFHKEKKNKWNKPDGLLIGQKTCRKEDPEQVASNSRNTDGTRMLNRMEWLSKPQIHLFFFASLC